MEYETAREGAAAALAADNKIYVVGGNGTGPVTGVQEACDPVANSWGLPRHRCQSPRPTYP